MLLAQDKKNMILKIKENQHEIYILSMSQFDTAINSSPAVTQKSWMKQDWVELNTKVKKVTNYSGSVKDIETIGKLIWEIGGYKTNVQFKSYGGKPHIILKGNPALRNVLTGTKYGIQNPKIVTLGLGEFGLRNSVKSSGIIAIVFFTAHNVLEYFLNDEFTLVHFVGTMATDIVKVGITYGAAMATASMIGTGGFTVFALGPLALVFAVGLGVTIVLSLLDEHYDITGKVITCLENISKNTEKLSEKVFYDGLNIIGGGVFDSIDNWK